ncbi:MAG: hypothetical protein DRJ62_07620, partial [Thermoprotei archaeon]
MSEAGRTSVVVIGLVVAVVVIGALAYLMLSSPSSSQLQSVVIRIGYQPSTHQVAEFILVEKNWIVEEAKKLGYNVTIVEEMFPSGPPEMERFMSGALDVVYVGATPVIAEVGHAIDTGAPIAKIVAPANTMGSALVMRSDFNYTGPQSLKGCRIGVFPPGSIQDTVMKKWLKDNGLTYGGPGEDVDVVLVSGGPQELVESLCAGHIDGALLPSPSPEILEMRGVGKIVVTSSEMWPNHACCVVAISDKFIRDYRDLAVLIVKLHIKAQQFISENVSETIDIATTRLSRDWQYNESFTRMVMEKSYIENPTHMEFPTDLNLIVDSVMEFAEVHYELGYIPVHLT